MAQRLVDVEVRLVHIEPVIWRKFTMVSRSTLADLHAAIQAAMPWLDSHLHRFELADACYVDASCDWDDWFDAEMRDEESVTLGSLLSRGIVAFTYIYDFGDDWEHEITISRAGSAEPGVAYPRVIDGARACPPEDCGGDPGYARLLEAIALGEDTPHGSRDADSDFDDDDAHEAAEMASLREWAGDFDPEHFTVAKAQRDMDMTFGLDPLEAEATKVLVPAGLGLYALHSREAPRAVLRFDGALSDAMFERAESVNTAAAILGALAASPAPVTSAGNLSLSEVLRLGAVLEVDKLVLSRVQSESELVIVDTFHRLLMVSSLVARRAGVLMVTPLGRRLIEPGRRASLAAMLFATYWEEFNPGYVDWLAPTPRLSEEFVATLALILEESRKWVTAQHLFASALSGPVKQELAHADARWHTGVDVLERRLLKSLVGFGLLEAAVVRGDANVSRYRRTSLAQSWLAFELQGPPELRPVDSPTAHDVLQEFLADDSTRTKRDKASFEGSAELLEHYLDGYGHELLLGANSQMWEAVSQSEEAVFTEIFGPRYLGEALPMFLSYFVPRKVMVGRSGTEAIARFGAALSQWLAGRGWFDSADEVVATAASLQLAARFEELLVAWLEEREDDVDDQDCVEDHFSITGVGEGMLMVRGAMDGVEYGMSPVSPAVARAAKVGMQFSGMLLPVRGVWQIVEVWNVYP